MSSQLTRQSTAPRRGVSSPARPAHLSTSQRKGTIDLETQSAYKFALAILLGVGAIWPSMPMGATVAILLVAIAITTASLAVLATDPQSPRTIRPREFASADGALSAALALIALVLVGVAAPAGAAVAGAGAIALAGLRLRTRYVTR